MNPPKNILKTLTITTALVAASLTSLPAATYTWDGLGVNTNWTTPENWNPDGAPANDGTSSLMFNANGTPPTGYYAPVVNTPYNINKLTLAATTSSGQVWNITGSALTFSGTGANITLTQAASNNSFNNTIANDIVLATNLSITVAGSNTNRLVLSGVISGDFAITNGFTLGELVLNGANTYTGGTNVSRGNLYIGNNAALGTGALNFTGGTTSNAVLNSGSTKTLANTVNLGAGAGGGTRFTGDFILSGPLVIGAASASTQSRSIRGAISSSLTINGQIQAASGATGAGQNFYTGGASSGSEGGSIAQQGNARVTIAGGGSFTGLTVIGNTSGVAQYGTVYVSSDISSSSATQVYNGMVLRGSGGKVAPVTVNAGAILAPGGTAASSTTLGTLNVVGSVSMAGTGTATDTISTLRIYVGTNGATSRVAITGDGAVVGDAFTIGSNVRLELIAPSLASLSSSYTIATWETGATPSSYGSFASITLGTGFSGGLSNGTEANWTNSGYWVEYRANSILLVPEPSTYALIAATGIIFMVFRRRKTSVISATGSR